LTAFTPCRESTFQKVKPPNLHHPPISGLCFETKSDYTEKQKQLKTKKPIVPAKDNCFSSPPIDGAIKPNQAQKVKVFLKNFHILFCGETENRVRNYLAKAL
jgi:hypothetical protein